MSSNVRKRTFWHVCPVKTQISLRIRGGTSESSFSTWKNFASLAIQNVPSEDSDQTVRMSRLIWIFAGCTCPKYVLWRCETFSFEVINWRQLSGNRHFSYVISVHPDRIFYPHALIRILIVRRFTFHDYCYGIDIASANCVSPDQPAHAHAEAGRDFRSSPNIDTVNLIYFFFCCKRRYEVNVSVWVPCNKRLSFIFLIILNWIRTLW